MAAMFPQEVPNYLIPLPEDTDSAEVNTDLRMASFHERSGDPAQALRWLRRAIYAAKQHNDQMRASKLTDVATELAALVRPNSSISHSTIRPHRLPDSSSPELQSSSPELQSSSPDIEALVREGRAIRVRIRRSLRDDAVYTLRSGSSERNGLHDALCREAVLLLVDEGQEFFSGLRGR